MLICFRVLTVTVAALLVAAGTAGCSKTRERPAAGTATEGSQRRQADHEQSDTRQAATTSTASDSEEWRGRDGGVAADNGGRANSADAKGGTSRQTVSERGSSRKRTVAPGSGSDYTSSGDPNYRPPSDPRAAQAAAERALAAAEKAARSEDYGAAYRTALTGWQQANTYAKQDEKCRELAQTLLNHLEQYGEKANRAAGILDAPSPSHKTIILE
jgi:hypothetical protein